ncbi:hypothetical protein L596_023670 [Steinernema carpocapsae]|uniref:Homeobox domain-containing protein n=1 Tax=Steinernema carpocapsae TaxID=34508 RepID=A0A4U5MEB6_STECR|nr:hypothetical protein L596_023670 [Steinernema carpocapsae]
MLGLLQSESFKRALLNRDNKLIECVSETVEMRSTQPIDILQSYTKRQREFIFADYERKMKIWKWIHSDDAGDFPDENETPNVPKSSSKTFNETPTARPKRGRQPKKPSPEVRRVSPVVKAVPPRLAAPTDTSKRIRRPTRIVQEQLEAERLYSPSPSIEDEEIEDAPVEKKRKSSSTVRRAHTPVEGGRKRIRMNYTDEQLELLKKAFEDDSYASRDMKDELAEQTGLSFIQVNKWFENRRKRDRDEASAKKPKRN